MVLPAGDNTPCANREGRLGIRLNQPIGEVKLQRQAKYGKINVVYDIYMAIIAMSIEITQCINLMGD